MRAGIREGSGFHFLPALILLVFPEMNFSVSVVDNFGQIKYLVGAFNLLIIFIS